MDRDVEGFSEKGFLVHGNLKVPRSFVELGDLFSFDSGRSLLTSF